METAESSDNPILSPPLIDLRLLSQSELHSLSFSTATATARTNDEFTVPRIDRSVFNESAGSRKQTYSRLRLAPRNQPNPRPPSSARIPEPMDEDNSKIISLLQDLFGVEPLRNFAAVNNHHDPVQVEFRQLALPPAAAAAVDNVPVDGSGQRRSRKRGRPRRNDAVPVPVPEENGGAAVAEEANVMAEEANAMAMVVAVAEDDQARGLVVEDVGDPFVEELIGRTQGLATEAEMLEFMEGLQGEWASQRKKRRLVEAGVLCDLLPAGWKLVLSLQRRAGVASVICRRYISPDGHQFESYKEVYTHLSSNRSNVNMASENQHVGHVPTSDMEIDANASSAYHEKHASIASSIETEKQASIARSIGTEKLNTYDGNSNSDLALKLGDASSGAFRDSDQTEDKQPLKADKNGANTVEGCSLTQDQAHLVDNNGLGLSVKLAEDHIQKMGFESSMLAPDSDRIFFAGTNLEDRHRSSSLEDFETSDGKLVKDDEQQIICGGAQSEIKDVSDNVELEDIINSMEWTRTSLLKDSAVGSLFGRDFPSACAQDASEPGRVDFTPNLEVGKLVNDNHVRPNEEVVTSCLQKRSSSDEQIFTTDNLLHRSSEANLFALTSDQHPSAFQDNMDISAGTVDVLNSVDAGCMEPQFCICSCSNVVAADACTSVRVMQGTSEGCVSVPLGESILNSFDKQNDDDVSEVKKSCVPEKAKSEVDMFQNDSMVFSENHFLLRMIA